LRNPRTAPTTCVVLFIRVHLLARCSRSSRRKLARFISQRAACPPMVATTPFTNRSSPLLHTGLYIVICKRAAYSRCRPISLAPGPASQCSKPS
jgi:hypothetical protein